MGVTGRWRFADLSRHQRLVRGLKAGADKRAGSAQCERCSNTAAIGDPARGKHRSRRCEVDNMSACGRWSRTQSTVDTSRNRMTNRHHLSEDRLQRHHSIIPEPAASGRLFVVPDFGLAVVRASRA